MNKNSLVAVAADRGASSWLRNWFYPPGAKELKIHIQAVNGWACLDPDPNVGFVCTTVTRPVNQSGRWLRGPMDPKASLRDVRIARALLGHRFWHVSTWRVWLYRALAFALLLALAMNFEFASLPLALVVAALIVAIPSPCTPRGVMQWCENMDFADNKMALNKGLDDDGLGSLREMIANPGAD